MKGHISLSLSYRTRKYSAVTSGAVDSSGVCVGLYLSCFFPIEKEEE